jgi:glyoxylase-like metal-dependent hydrolase (beta-lactamase superfamily II)
MKVQYQDILHGITTIDTGFIRPGFTASHLVVEDEEAAFIDIGPASTLAALLDVLRQKGISRENVRYVLVTHVHLDHAGGAGKLLQELPNAELVVHPKGARHLIDPERLIKGAAAVYGEEGMQTLFGDTVPVPRERVLEPEDGYCLKLGGRQLLIRHTPGHARHHYCVVDERSQGIFTGDTFGVSYRECDTAQGHFIFPATAPTQFEPDKLHASIDLLMTYSPTCLYLTHFGRVTDVSRLAENLHLQIDQLVDLARAIKGEEEERHHILVEQVQHLIETQLISHADGLPDLSCCLDLLTNDITLGVMGLEVWLARMQKHQSRET